MFVYPFGAVVFRDVAPAEQKAEIAQLRSAQPKLTSTSVINEELSVREGNGVIHVRCTAVGSLPKGRTTRTFIDYGGNPAERQRVIQHVLEIVAEGVVTRLAAIERGRRAQVAEAKP